MAKKRVTLTAEPGAEKRKSTKADKKRPTNQAAQPTPADLAAAAAAAAAAAGPCTDLLAPKPGDTCRYTADACCKEIVCCRPNHYPGLLKVPQKMAVAGSEDGSYDSLCKLLRAGLNLAERVLVMTPWGNYVLIRAHGEEAKVFFLYDGCTCNINRFRYLDLNCGTAGFLYFNNLHDALTYVLEARERRENERSLKNNHIEEMCAEFEVQRKQDQVKQLCPEKKYAALRKSTTGEA